MMATREIKVSLGVVTVGQLRGCDNAALNARMSKGIEVGTDPFHRPQHVSLINRLVRSNHVLVFKSCLWRPIQEVTQRQASVRFRERRGLLVIEAQVSF